MGGTVAYPNFVKFVKFAYAFKHFDADDSGVIFAEQIKKKIVTNVPSIPLHKADILQLYGLLNLEISTPFDLTMFTQYIFYESNYKDIILRVPDVGKIKRELGWSASTTLEEGVKITLDWDRKNKWWLSQ